MNTSFDSMKIRLNSIGVGTLDMECGRTGKALVLPEFGRVIGLWTDTCDQSLLWFNGQFPSRPAGQSVWLNPGGDRLWLSPEIDFFITDHADPLDNYIVPAAIDPGDYQYTEVKDEIRLTNTGIIAGYLSGTRTEFKTTRSFGCLSANQLAGFDDEEVAIAGYQEQTTLELPRGTQSGVSFWNITQVPTLGRVYVGIASADVEPVLYLGDTGKCIEPVSDRMLPVRFEGNQDYKFGIRREDSAGYIAYLREQPEHCTLLVRTFTVEPEGHYVDVPPDGRSGTPCPVQLYFGGSTYNFGEIEYHSPALTAESDSKICRQTSCLYGFTGSKASILRILSRFGAGICG